MCRQPSCYVFLNTEPASKKVHIVQLVFCDKLGNDTVGIALKQNTLGEYKVLYQ